MESLRKLRRRQRYAYTWVISILCFLFVIFLAFLGGGLGWNTSQNDKLHSRNKLSVGETLQYNSINGVFRLRSSGHSDTLVLSGVLSDGTTKDWHSVPCDNYTGAGKCIEWQKQVRLTIETHADDDITCYAITWSALAEHVIPRDCFLIGDAHWYGGAEVSNQRWPIENGDNYEMFPFLPGADGTGPYDEALLERYWLSSKGVAIKADDTIPLFVDWNANNNGKFCLVSQFSTPYQHLDQSFPSLKYHICQADDLKKVHVATAAKFFPKPSSVVAKRMPISPIWSPAANNQKEINETKIMAIANEIISGGYNHSQIEINDMFTSSFGAMDFDEDNFPNVTAMMSTLKGKFNMRVTMRVHPFAKYESLIFKEGLEKKYWVQDLSGKVPALVPWRGMLAALLDVTNSEATKWFSDKLRRFKEKYSIDSYTCDAGSAMQLPSSYRLNTPLNNTAYFTTKYVQLCAKLGEMGEVGVGYRNQDQPIIFRLQNMDSNWDFNNGLKTLIPRVFYFGLAGYPFLLPGTIGGNANNGFPERELYIRWMQVSAFMPSWQFSITPWEYDNETISIAKDMMTIRDSFLKPYLLKCAKEALHTGAPIVRPLWWLSPGDDTAHTTETQFLVGDDVMVAPVLNKGDVSRDIYIPYGTWRDENNRSSQYVGPTWLRNHPVPLQSIPYFLRLGG